MHWWEWSGWAFIGNVAQVLSLIAIGFVIYEFAERRRRVRSVVWSFDAFGSGTLNDQAVVFYDFTNSGSGAALLASFTLIGAKLVMNVSHRPRPTMGPGETITLCLNQDGLASDAWLLIVWRSSDDRGVLHAEWMPIMAGSELETKYRADFQSPRWYELTHGPFRGRFPKAVGPGAALRTSMRSSRDAHKSQRRTTAALKRLVQEDVVSGWTPGATTDTPSDSAPAMTL